MKSFGRWLGKDHLNFLLRLTVKQLPSLEHALEALLVSSLPLKLLIELHRASLTLLELLVKLGEGMLLSHVHLIALVERLDLLKGNVLHVLQEFKVLC